MRRRPRPSSSSPATRRILEVRKQENPPCDESEEQYEPTTVNTVLGNPLVVLQHIQGKRQTRDHQRRPPRRRSPAWTTPTSSTSPATRSGDDCGYARDFAALKKAGKAPAVTYAHIAREAGTTGSSSSTGSSGTSTSSTTCTRATGRACRSPSTRTTPQEALANGPSEIGLFQHAGGERADWDDEQGAEGGDPPGRLSGRRLARDLLQLGGLHPERQGGARAWAATTPPSRCGGSCPGRC